MIMYRLKNLIISILLILSVAGLFVGCDSSSDDDNLVIVTTIYPVYDWVNEILGEQAENATVTYLTDDGVDLHSYQATTADIATIYGADMFIYVGGESDSWAEDVLSNANAEGLIAISLFDILGDAVVEEESVEGMEEEHDHDDEEDHDHDEEDVELDEHVWLSLSNAKVICEYLKAKICELDESNTSEYQANCTSYISELSELDSEYETAVLAGAKDTILFADRFPFRYLVDDYGLNYYAAFAGCSTETNASAETIAYLVGKVDELQLEVILVIEDSDCKIADTIVEASENKTAQILTLNSLQSVNLKSIDEDFSYISVMKSNLAVLKLALA